MNSKVKDKEIIESVRYTLRENDTIFQIKRKSNIANVVGRWQFKRASEEPPSD